MTYDLRHERWIPWRRRSGTVEWGPPWLLTDGIAGDDPIVALAAPRPDFDGALQEFLIGLLGVALQVADDEAWEALWRSPPTPQALRTALDRLPQAFDLDGDGARCFQAFPADDLAAEAPLGIEELLVDSKTSTLFVKSGRVERMSRPAAAMALLTMQTYAPEGGRGHFTSLRGGGPLTTLVDPRMDVQGQPPAHELPLWRKLWANVETVQQAAARAPGTAANSPEDVFPWLAPVRSTPGSRVEITEANANPWQAYFGLPRRIRLDFSGPGRCDLTDREDEVTVTGFRLRPNGVRYGTWRHPLSPHYQSAGKEMLPVHGQPGGIGWRDWIGTTLGGGDGKREPARRVAGFSHRARSLGLREARLHAFGLDTNKAKIRGWTDASQPVFVATDDAHQQLLRDAAGRLTEGASIAASMLHGESKRALFQSADDAPGDLSAVKTELWASTETPFFQSMRAIAAPGASITAADEVCQRFARTLTHEALAVFDRWCPGDALEPVAMRRVVTARYNLARALGGWTPLGEKLFEVLRIPLPGGGRAARLAKSARSRTRKEVRK
ncbi:MAG TPA: type I-E CRISPR-associated protein Cse1/CasA [Gemmatimonadaceae bacterium]